MEDCIRHGTSARGSRHYGARLNAAMVQDARARFTAGERIYRLAHEFGVTEGTMREAIRGLTWGWLAGAIPAPPVGKYVRGHGRDEAAAP